MSTSIDSNIRMDQFVPATDQFSRAVDYLQNNPKRPNSVSELREISQDHTNPLESRRLALEEEIDILGESLNSPDPMRMREGMKRKREELKAKLVEQIEGAKEKADSVQELIKNDPQVLEKVVAQAQEEAAIIQRIALGHKIRKLSNDGNRAPAEGTIDDFVEKYNRREVYISPKEYETAELAYAELINKLRDSVFEKDKRSRELELMDFFNPYYQVRAEVPRPRAQLKPSLE